LDAQKTGQSSLTQQIRLLILSLNYAPEPTGFAPHATALAEHLAAVGHDIKVITDFPFAPRWKRWPEYRGSYMKRERINGVDVMRIAHYIPRRPGSALQRIVMEGTFACNALLAAIPVLLRSRRCDAVLYIGAQPAIAWLARLLAAVMRIPYIVKITDLAAMAASEVGIVKSNFLANVLNRFEFSAYHKATTVIVLCESFTQALISKGFRAESIHLIRDSVDLSLIKPGGDGASFRNLLCLKPTDFVILYSGSLGLKQGLFHVLQAAKLLAQTNPEIRWVLIGEGESRLALSQQIVFEKLDSIIQLLPLQPESDMIDVYASADVLLLSQLRSVKNTVIPSKLLTYMAAGKPVLAAVNRDSQAAAIVRESGGGVIVEPEDAQALANAVRMLRGSSSMPEMGQWNRAYAVRNLDRKTILEAQESVIKKAVLALC
jgi:colanic acid biosynthesis glycosyl transferase WcaI